LASQLYSPLYLREEKRQSGRFGQYLGDEFHQLIHSQGQDSEHQVAHHLFVTANSCISASKIILDPTIDSFDCTPLIVADKHSIVGGIRTDKINSFMMVQQPVSFFDGLGDDAFFGIFPSHNMLIIDHSLILASIMPIIKIAQKQILDVLLV
jgi:hypothetical protein